MRLLANGPRKAVTMSAERQTQCPVLMTISSPSDMTSTPEYKGRPPES